MYHVFYRVIKDIKWERRCIKLHTYIFRVVVFSVTFVSSKYFIDTSEKKIEKI